jgi:hypothetical protein
MNIRLWPKLALALTFYEVVVPPGTNINDPNWPTPTSPYYLWCNTKTFP